MEHKERMSLAQQLSDRLVKKHRKGILICGLYGSTSKKTDTPYSDLELMIIATNRSRFKGKSLLYKDIVVNYEVIKERQIKELVSKPGLRWPYYMGVLSIMKVLYGNQKYVDDLILKGKSIPEDNFRKKLQELLPSMVFESYGRILSCKDRSYYDDLYPSVIEVVMEMNLALCLLNRSWVTHDYYRGVEDAYSFDKLPRGYKKLTRALWKQQTPNLDENVALVEKLINNYLNLLKKENITINRYNSINQLPV
jgi:hypothetical protein